MNVCTKSRGNLFGRCWDFLTAWVKSATSGKVNPWDHQGFILWGPWWSSLKQTCPSCICNMLKTVTLWLQMLQWIHWKTAMNWRAWEVTPHTKSKSQVSPERERENEAKQSSLKQSIMVIKLLLIVTHQSIMHQKIHPYLLSILCLFSGYSNMNSIIIVSAVVAFVLIFGTPLIKRYSPDSCMYIEQAVSYF